MSSVLLLNGPNLNLLGQREPDIYGGASLEQIVASLEQQASQQGWKLEHMQSNAEHELIDAIQQHNHDWIIFNPGGFTHTSVALRDALLATDAKFIEVHLSNVAARESFRRHSYFSDIAQGVISGFGAGGYRLALQAITSEQD